MPYANSINEPDGAVAMGGFCLGIVLMPIGFLSLLTIAIWVLRKRQNFGQETTLNSVEKE